MTAAKQAQTTEKIVLSAEKREVTGKKVKALREEGKLPANIFGKDFESTAITLDGKDFLRTYRTAGETSVVYVTVGKDELPVIITNLHMDPISGDIMHADLRKIDLKIKIEANVPVVIIGESEPVENKSADLLTLVDTLTVSALPTDVPHEIEVDISGLKEFDDAITVADLKSKSSFEFVDDPETMIVKIAEHIEEDTETATPDDEAAEGAEAPAAGGDEAQAETSDASEGDKPADDAQDGE